MKEKTNNEIPLSDSQTGAFIHEKIYIDVTYTEKDQASSLGAKWDRAEKSWYVPSGVDLKLFEKWTKPQQNEVQATQKNVQEEKREYLSVPYGEREIAKAAGALWDKEVKSWYKGPNAIDEQLAKYTIQEDKNYQTPPMTPEQEFAETLGAAGCILSGEHPIMDGKKHRIETEGDKQGERSGFYVGHLDGLPAGYVKNNRTGAEAKWKYKGYALTDEEKANLKAIAAEKIALRADALVKAQAEAAERVNKQLTTEFRPVVPTDVLPYLEDKGISTQANEGVYINETTKTLCIPAMDIEGKIWTAQYIRDDGTKRFSANGKKEGCFHLVNSRATWENLYRDDSSVIIVTTGYATGKSIADVTAEPVIVAFSDNNLKPVVEQLQAKFPEKGILIAGDDDKHLLHHPKVRKNMGKDTAETVARELGCTAIVPVFAPGEQAGDLKRFTDFNDLANHSQHGKAGVEMQIKAGIAKELQRKYNMNQARLQQREQVQEQKKKEARGGLSR